MNIGIDIDDTITETYQTLLPMVAMKYGMNVTKFMSTVPSYKSLNILPNYDSIRKEIFPAMAKIVPLKKDVVEVLNKLRREGHRIIFITARKRLEYDNPYQISYDYLKANNVPFDELYAEIDDKATKCILEGIDLFIDDNTNNCKAVQKRGVPTLQMDALFNRNVKTLKKVSSWWEVYDIVQEMCA